MHLFFRSWIAGFGYQSELLATIALNDDPSVTDHAAPAAAEHLTPRAVSDDPYKDVEGVNPANIGLFPTSRSSPSQALVVNERIHAAAPIRGADAVVVGQSRIAGRPIGCSLTTQMATVTAATRDAI